MEHILELALAALEQLEQRSQVHRRGGVRHCGVLCWGLWQTGACVPRPDGGLFSAFAAKLRMQT